MLDQTPSADTLEEKKVTELCIAQSRAEKLFREVETRGLIRAGITESHLNRETLRISEGVVWDFNVLAQTDRPRGSQYAATVRCEEMIARFTQWQGKNPQSIAAHASYGNGELLQWLMDRQITPYMPTRDGSDKESVLRPGALHVPA